MKKGQVKRIWTPEQKSEIVHKHLDEHVSLRALEKEYRADRSMICKWVKRYLMEGESSFTNKIHPGNPFAALHVSKNLSEIERLRLLVAKLEIENERLKKRILGERSWCRQGIRYWQRREFEVIDTLRSKYPVTFLCNVMGLNRSGYYKWKSRQGKPNRYEKDRILLTQLLKEEHQKHPSHGYHRLADDVFVETGWIFSHSLAHKCCKAAGIRSKARKYRYKKSGEESVKFCNEVKGCWNAKKPLEIIVSDMTIFKHKGIRWEWTLLLDTFNNEILAHQATPIPGNNKPYFHCLERLKLLAGKKKEQTPQIVFHTDQGSVYSSRAFCQAHEHYNILRSMSRAGTPTDNPIIEALNGWMKEELYLDFGLASTENVPALLEQYVYYFNNRRPAAALGYKNPVQYKTELGF